MKSSGLRKDENMVTGDYKAALRLRSKDRTSEDEVAKSLRN
jgi:hypothetical protein